MTKTPARDSVSIEDYLKAIYRLTQGNHDFATTSSIARELRISPPSVSGMMRRLARQRLVAHTRYQGARLTAEGERRALRILRRHRLLELFLHKCLNLGWDEIHVEAEILEHALSDRLEQRLDEWLEYPAFDPHGEPIPNARGQIKWRELTPLSETPLKRSAVVAQVRGGDSALLKYCAERRILPNRKIVVLSREPIGGLLKVKVAGRVQYLGLPAAEQLMVELL